ncbi:phage protein [Streptococcus canis]|nr:phage protein [Streptococcus canis]
MCIGDRLLSELGNEDITIKGHEYSKRFIDFLEYLAESEDEFTAQEILIIDTILEQFENSKGE